MLAQGQGGTRLAAVTVVPPPPTTSSTSKASEKPDHHGGSCVAYLPRCPDPMRSRACQPGQPARHLSHPSTGAWERGSSSKPVFVGAAGPVARGDSPLGQATQAAVSQAYQIGTGPGR